MVHKPLKPGFADAVEVQKHLLADGLRPIKEAVRWTSFSFSPIASIAIKAWMFAKTTKSSSTWDSSRKLYRLSRTVSSVNWSEHWLLFNPRRHPHPSYMNFCTLVMILSLFSVWLQSISTLVDSSILRLWYKPSYLAVTRATHFPWESLNRKLTVIMQSEKFAALF